ncbi:MAG TPA: copper transporter [Bacillota bacterium]|nr:copper transporter [Bacillota bacterium]
MIIDIRYHIASLVAVFLALGLGILIGSALLGNDALINEQEKIISRLEKEFDRLKAEQKSKEELVREKDNLLAIDQRFSKAVLPTILNGKLADRRIAIIRSNDSTDLQISKDLSNIFKAAGADVSVVATIKKWPNLSDPVERQATAQVFGLNPTKSHWMEELFSTIIEELSLGRPSPLLTSLQNQDYFAMNNIENHGPVDTIVFLGGENIADNIQNKRIDLYMIDAAKRAGLTVVGAEPAKTPVSYMGSYRKKGLTTVDNIDMAPGQVALVLALADGKRGDYGIKEGAKLLMPEVNVNKH